MSLLDRRTVTVALMTAPLCSVVACGRAHAQGRGQKDWRYCGKCHAMFFDGYSEKGRCAAGGGHEASGLNFVLPHDVAETRSAQRNWRYCGKCHGMFFDGYPQKGSCPAGAGHQAIGFNFVLPHDIGATNKSQGAWRFCQKCSAMYFDGYPNKGVCPKGGGHQAAGFMFVLPHVGDVFANGLEASWREAGRGIVAEKIKQALNGREFRKGVNGYNPNVNLGDMSASWRRTGPMSIAVEMRVPGNNVELKTTQPTVLGSFADPSFRVGFNMLLRVDMRAQAGAPNIVVNVLAAEISNASVRGSNASGTIVESVADFFSKGRFTREVTRGINDDQNVKASLQNAINAALGKIPSFRLP